VFTRTRSQAFRRAISPMVARLVVIGLALTAAGIVLPTGSISASRAPRTTRDAGARVHFLRPPVYHRTRRNGCPTTGCPPLNAHLTYGGGPVVHSLTVYTIFWQAPGYHFEAPYGGPGTTVADFRYEGLIDRFFADAGSTPYYNIMTQYSDQSGPVQNTVTFGGSVVDLGKLNQFNPSDLGTAAQPLQDSDIQAVITQAATDRSWPLGSPNVEYFVFTPATVHSCYSSTSCDAEIDSGSGAYCAYHSNFASASGTVLYANMFDAGYSTACGGPNWEYKGKPVGPFDGYGPNGDAVADYEISPASHEMAEAVTDPTPNNGWFDVTNSNEIGDTCAYDFTPLNPDQGDVVLGSHSYLIQTEWSNATKSCAISYNRPATLPVNSKADSVPALGATPLCPNAPGGDSSNPHYFLRCAIEDANNDALAGTTNHVITFKKCGSSCAVKLGSPLPALQAPGLAIAGGGRASLLGGHAVRRGLLVDARNIAIGGLTVQQFRGDAIDVVNSLFVTIGGKKGDTLRNNGGYGLTVGGSTSDSSKVTVTSNRIYGNARGGINLLGLRPGKCAAGLNVGAPNDYLPCPSILTASPGTVSGTSSCDEHCTVQLFLVPKRQDISRHGQARAYIGQALVSSGAWSITPRIALVSGQKVTATVTDPDRRETSEFSANAAVQ
jgi:hypothetical protein